MRTLKMTVEYDGSQYHGWQSQSGLPTVQATLEYALAKITGESPVVVGSGRTDAGVHALNQVAHFRIEKPLAEGRLLLALNSILPGDIVVKELTEAAAGFHARYDVMSKVYRYRILNRPTRPAVGRQYAWHIRAPLEVKRMEAALDPLKGTHDFSSFCASGCLITDRVRTVLDAAIVRDPAGFITITLEADGFLRHMVRNLVGTLVEVGRLKRSPEGLKELLAARDRRQAGITAPAQGLFLAEVKY